MFDVVLPENGRWYQGLDLQFLAADMELLVPALVGQELDSGEVGMYFIFGDYPFIFQVCMSISNNVQKVQLTCVREGVGRGLRTTKSIKEGGKIMDVACLWFSGRDSLQAFMQKPGNQCWGGCVVSVEGVLREGLPKTLYFVMVGLGQYLNHYVGIKKKSNARLEVDPTKGFGHGSVELYAHTRNNVGIQSGMEILINYGSSFDLTLETPGQNDTPVKRIRGALDEFVTRKVKEQANLEAGGEDSEKEEQKKKEEEEKKKEEEKKEEEGKEKKEEEKKKKEEEKKKQEADAAAGGAAGVSGPVTGGGQVLAIISDPPGKLLLQDHKLIFELQNATNKKLYPNVSLHTWTAGVCGKKEGDNGCLDYDMKPGTYIYNRAQRRRETVSKMVTDTKAVSVWGYKTFKEAGKSGKVMAPGMSQRTFIPKDRATMKEINGVVDAAKACVSVEVVYVFKPPEDSKKELAPAGLALVTKAQTILKPGKNVLG